MNLYLFDDISRIRGQFSEEWGDKHMVDFTSRFLDPQWVYRQNLLVSDQLGKGSKVFYLRMDL